MPRHSTTAALVCACLLLIPATGLAQRKLGFKPTGSGGPLMPEQAAYDVKYYDLALRVDPDAKTIRGALTVTARVVKRIEWFVLDLDEPLAVDSVALVADGAERPLRSERRGGRLWIAAEPAWEPGTTAVVKVAYGGSPRVAPAPPWVGGFVWSKTPSGAPWVGVACQNDGADVWWPCKDHPSDKPDGVALHVTVPAGLVCAANGRFEGARENADGTKTFDWRVSTPISNYAVSIGIAPYVELKAEYESVTGEKVPVSFFALPEHEASARALLAEYPSYVRFLEEKFGPYPWRADKLGVVETPYLGMEHQTATAYGADFKKNADGFDGLLFHELGHDWWANLVTAPDWDDFWIHEGFQSYTDALYAERLRGPEALRARMRTAREHVRNRQPIAPRGPRTTVQMYLVAPDYVDSDGDIYGKGALVLDTLRYLIGDKAFFASMRKMAYPKASLERETGGEQFHFGTTDDFERIAERESKRKLDWFFEVYARQERLPRLVTERTTTGVTLRWESPVPGMTFAMPVEVEVDGKRRRVDMKRGTATVAGANVVVDPDGRVLKE